jgi:hypothetical protein
MSDDDDYTNNESILGWTEYEGQKLAKVKDFSETDFDGTACTLCYGSGETHGGNPDACRDLPPCNSAIFIEPRLLPTYFVYRLRT